MEPSRSGSKGDSWMKKVFTGRKKVDKERIDEIIIENYNNELEWDQFQAIAWITNILDTSFPSDKKLAQILEDGVVLCNLLKTVAPDVQINKFHFNPKIPSQVSTFSLLISSRK